MPPAIFAASETAPFNAAFRATLARHAPLLDRREAAGKVRRCHGDLHLRNICMLDGEPRLFDCIEFNDQIATIDVLYDLAFLLMDLWHRGFPELANLVTNRYLDEADDEDGFVLLPFFMAVRAAVRAHVTATQVNNSSVDVEKIAAEARSYFELARLMLQKHPARLIAIGGLSGSGKTTIAEALAAHVGAPPGARIVESDRIRKAMHGVAPETRLPEKAYRPEVSAKVYREMAWRAALILAEGGSVVADAVFDNAGNRELIEKAAREASVPFAGSGFALIRQSSGNASALVAKACRTRRSISWLGSCSAKSAMSAGSSSTPQWSPPRSSLGFLGSIRSVTMMHPLPRHADLKIAAVES